MEDPRVTELLECIDDVDDSGKPTKLAQIAKRVEGYLESIEETRNELKTFRSEIEKLESRAETLSALLQDRNSAKLDLTDEAQDAAVRAALATNSSGATLRKTADSKLKALKQFEGDFTQAEKRLKEVNRALESRRQRLVDSRNVIARNMNVIDSLLQAADIEWPQHYAEEGGAEGGQSKGASVRRRRRGRRRVVRRRAS